MIKLIKRHKTTITGIITALLCLGGVVRYFLGQIDATELMAFTGIVNTVAITIVGAFAKDGEVKKKCEEPNQ
ncbi:hypothetical protein Q4E40_02520 [Pontibacter sp. BT731]|uniref:hypothetical protein n=1 Tax=Pontibacter coccineus TaxID=3063328 RepID=UPI0026E4023E|nr:hypothetical protein [Pontibacter sp. BT731]MDO6388986.1 hypothetical protein [Pontibacter sp. BT731]